ncbi:tetratricopeptide repeat protein [Holophaga foetida]|uniref:tetratricopeptide repeat protein n=1 Tax=Holophaga foetida TaxID=35839 RepID=UPI00024753BA|nr:tetratricopeptide repeat protein [Holophaga foetida]
MRALLHYLLLDGFDPDTAELALRVGVYSEDGSAPQVLRMKLFLGRSGDPLQPLRRELQTHIQMPIPQIWDRGLKIVVHAIEEDMSGPDGRNPARYAWVSTQILHPSDERRGTLGHPAARQVEILWDWAQRLDQEGYPIKAIELLERLLLLSPQHSLALEWLSILLRHQGLMEETLGVVDRFLAIRPGDIEALLRKGEALLHLERLPEALLAFESILKVSPVHALAHLGAGQAKSLAGGDPCPHLDAALELDRDATISVLQETFDFRILSQRIGETVYPPDELALLLGVSPGEVRSLIQHHGLPVTGPEGTVREPELSRWVSLQNRYHLLPISLHWMAPTPRHIPELH